MKNRIILSISALFLLLGIGIPLASAATTSTTLGDNTSHIYTCNHSAPLTVSGQTASSVNVACGARPVSTTTTTQPTTTTTQPTTTTTQPTTTTTQPTTTTTTQPGSGKCVTGDQSNLNGNGDGKNDGDTAFKDPTDINNSNGFNTYVENNVWGDLNINNNITLCGTSPSNWNVSVPGIGDAGDQNGAVQAYPNVQQLYTDWTATSDNGTPVSQAGAPTVASTFSTNAPNVNQGQWEFGYDLWSAGQYNNDIMIWTDTSVARLQDNGAVVVNTNVVIDGVSYTLLQNGGCTPLSCLAVNKNDGPQPEIMFVRNTNVTSGTENPDHFIQYLQTAGIVPASYEFGQIDYGVEVCDTDGASMTWAVNGYTLTRTPVEPS